MLPTVERAILRSARILELTMPKPNATETDSSNTSRDPKGRFLTANNGGPGRPKGSRNKLGEAFIQALSDDFAEHGVDTIRQVRMRDPISYVKVVANVLPREVLLASLNLNASVNIGEIEAARGFLEAYRYARDRIGAVPPIEGDQPHHAEEGVVVTEAWRVED